MTASQRERPDVVARRSAFMEQQRTMDAEHVIFVDESGMVRGTRLGYGYALRSKRCVESAPFRMGKRTDLLGWIGLRGGIVAPLIGSVTAGVFTRFVEHVLVPHLGEGDVVVWDNARIHAQAAVALIESVGARVVWQPPYSPDLNAIEPFWSKVKHLVGKARADTAEAFEQARRAAIASVTHSDVAGWMRHCGYAPPS